MRASLSTIIGHFSIFMLIRFQNKYTYWSSQNRLRCQANSLASKKPKVGQRLYKVCPSWKYFLKKNWKLSNIAKVREFSLIYPRKCEDGDGIRRSSFESFCSHVEWIFNCAFKALKIFEMWKDRNQWCSKYWTNVKTNIIITTLKTEMKTQNHDNINTETNPNLNINMKSSTKWEDFQLISILKPT